MPGIRLLRLHHLRATTTRRTLPSSDASIAFTAFSPCASVVGAGMWVVLLPVPVALVKTVDSDCVEVFSMLVPIAGVWVVVAFDVAFVATAEHGSFMIRREAHITCATATAAVRRAWCVF